MEVVMGVIMLLMSGASAKIAEKKGYNPYLWFFIGPIGLVVILIKQPRPVSYSEAKRLAKIERQVAKAQQFINEHMECPMCGGIIKRESKVCTQCGHIGE